LTKAVINFLLKEIQFGGQFRPVALTTGKKKRVDEKAQYMSGNLCKLDLEWKFNSLMGLNNNGDSLPYITVVINQPRSILTPSLSSVERDQISGGAKYLHEGFDPSQHLIDMGLRWI
jgi:hypothetical protein